MLTLSIDTAADRCAVALWRGGPDDGRLGAARELVMPTGHGEHLFTLVSEALGEAGAVPRDISRVVAVSGPGTFTGLRIGLAAARGLALALGIPALGITAFELAAAADREDSGEEAARLVALDARRAELYVQPLDAGLAPLAEPFVATPEGAAGQVEAETAVIVGSGAARLAAALGDIGRQVPARTGARAPAGLLARLGASRDPASHPAAPLYVRPPDARPQAPPIARMAAT